ncbi:protein gurken-like [Episyrphus balteatus]|uniref:protein gurken-like n=1 Tax=Episyrphus balteatus TaxID=286459 RepID=UPI0024858211|nr:protein gurken-like [Episyrphus balteatus]
MMFRINIILMLSTIIPDLDCCSSFKIFNRKSIHLYPASGIELSIHKSMQYQQNIHNHHLLLQQQTSQLTPQNEDGGLNENIRTSFWHKYFKFLDLKKYSKTKQSDEPSSHAHKPNKSLTLDIQNQREQTLEHLFVYDQQQQGQFSPLSISTITTDPVVGEPPTTTGPPSTTTTTKATTTTKSQHQYEQQDDVQFKLISEIVSLECVDILKLEFCLNGGRCFLYPILNHSLTSCECAEGFVGERCEAKSYEFIPRIRPRLVLAKTKGGPLVYGLAIVDVLFLLFLLCKNYNRD